MWYFLDTACMSLYVCVFLSVLIRYTDEFVCFQVCMVRCLILYSVLAGCTVRMCDCWEAVLSNVDVAIVCVAQSWSSVLEFLAILLELEIHLCFCYTSVCHGYLLSNVHSAWRHVSLSVWFLQCSVSQYCSAWATLLCLWHGHLLSKNKQHAAAAMHAACNTYYLSFA